MFRAHSPIDRSTRCEVAAYGLCTMRVYSADGAVRVARHPTNRTHDLRSSSQDHHPSTNWENHSEAHHGETNHSETHHSETHHS